MSPMSVLTRGVAVLGLAGALLAPARAGIFDDDGGGLIFIHKTDELPPEIGIG